MGNAQQHLNDSEDIAQKNMKSKLNKRLMLRRSQVENKSSNRSGDDASKKKLPVIHIPSISEDMEVNESTTNIANSILGTIDENEIADTKVRTVLAHTRAAPRNTFVPARRRTLKRRGSSVVRDIKKQVLEASLARDDQLNQVRATRF